MKQLHLLPFPQAAQALLMRHNFYLFNLLYNLK
jgi:hypothetical protein